MTPEVQTVWCGKCLDESYTDHPHTEGWEHDGTGWQCQTCLKKGE